MISVIISTFNKAEYLELTLAAFVNQSCNEFEIVIVNDGGNDNTADIVAAFTNQLNINYIEMPQNVEKAKARNIGVKHASGDFLIFTDDDRIPNYNFIKEHKNTLELYGENSIVFGRREKILSIWKNGDIGIYKEEYINYARKNRSIIKSLKNTQEKKLINADDIINNFDEIISKFQITRKKDIFMSIAEAFEGRFDSCYFIWAVGSAANVSCSKTFFEKSGGFDEKYISWGVEDFDLFYRFYLNGGQFRYNEEACNYHQVHLRGENEKEDLYNNLTYFCTKYGTEEIKLFLEWKNGEISIEDANDKIFVLKQKEGFDKSKKKHTNFKREFKTLRQSLGI